MGRGREQRHVGRNLEPSYERQRVSAEDSDLTRDSRSATWIPNEFADRRLERCWQGMALPHREFAKGRRVTQAVIVVNKRLPEVLAHVEERHDELRPPR